MRLSQLILPVLLLPVLLAEPAQARKYRAKGARSKAIDSLIAFRPVTQIGLIREGDALVADDSFSMVSRQMTEGVMNDLAPRMKMRRLFRTADESLQEQLDAEVAGLFVAAHRREYLEDGGSCPRIDSVARAQGMDFVLLVCNSGFLRTRSNYKTEQRRNLGPSIASLGMYNRVSFAAGSDMEVMVLDLKQRRCYYYCNSYGPEIMNQHSPVDPAVLRKQFMALLNYFFWGPELE